MKSKSFSAAAGKARSKSKSRPIPLQPAPAAATPVTMHPDAVAAYNAVFAGATATVRARLEKTRWRAERRRLQKEKEGIGAVATTFEKVGKAFLGALPAKRVLPLYNALRKTLGKLLPSWLVDKVLKPMTDGNTAKKQLKRVTKTGKKLVKVCDTVHCPAWIAPASILSYSRGVVLRVSWFQALLPVSRHKFTLWRPTFLQGSLAVLPMDRLRTVSRKVGVRLGVVRVAVIGAAGLSG